MKHTTPESRDPAELRPHSILAHIPAPAKDASEVCACADAIREQDGHLLPLVIDETNQILTDDSRLRWMAAKRMGMDDVPVVVQPGALAPVIALNAITHRAHYTKSAIAYLAVPLLKPALDAARLRRAEMLKTGGKSLTASGGQAHYAPTYKHLAKALGISADMLERAEKVHAEFGDKKQYRFEIKGGPEDGSIVEQTLKQHFEPKILRQQVDSEHEEQRPIGLGGVIKAIGSVRTYDELDGKKPESQQLDLFTDGLEMLRRRARIYENLTDADKRKARAKIQELVEAMPFDVRDEIFDAIKAARKQES